MLFVCVLFYVYGIKKSCGVLSTLDKIDLAVKLIVTPAIPKENDKTIISAEIQFGKKGGRVTVTKFDIRWINWTLNGEKFLSLQYPYTQKQKQRFAEIQIQDALQRSWPKTTMAENAEYLYVETSLSFDKFLCENCGVYKTIVEYVPNPRLERNTTEVSQSIGFDCPLQQPEIIWDKRTVINAANSKEKLIEGTDVELACWAAGYPPPVIVWWGKDTGKTTETKLQGRVLNFKTNSSIQKTYRCVATQDFIDMSSVNFTIEVEEQFHNPTMTFNGLREIDARTVLTFKLNDTFYLQCSSDHHVGNYKWWYNTREWGVGEKITLTINKNSAGAYWCSLTFTSKIGEPKTLNSNALTVRVFHAKAPVDEDNSSFMSYLVSPIGGIAVVGLISFGMYWWWKSKKRSRNKEHKQSTKNETMGRFRRGTVGEDITYAKSDVFGDPDRPGSPARHQSFSLTGQSTTGNSSLSTVPTSRTQSGVTALATLQSAARKASIKGRNDYPLDSNQQTIQPGNYDQQGAMPPSPVANYSVGVNRQSQKQSDGYNPRTSVRQYPVATPTPVRYNKKDIFRRSISQGEPGSAVPYTVSVDPMSSPRRYSRANQPDQSPQAFRQSISQVVPGSVAPYSATANPMDSARRFSRANQPDQPPHEFRRSISQAVPGNTYPDSSDPHWRDTGRRPIESTTDARQSPSSDRVSSCVARYRAALKSSPIARSKKDRKKSQKYIQKKAADSDSSTDESVVIRKKPNKKRQDKGSPDVSIGRKKSKDKKKKTMIIEEIPIGNPQMWMKQDTKKARSGKKDRKKKADTGSKTSIKTVDTLYTDDSNLSRWSQDVLEAASEITDITRKRSPGKGSTSTDMAVGNDPNEMVKRKRVKSTNYMSVAPANLAPSSDLSTATDWTPQPHKFMLNLNDIAGIPTGRDTGRSRVDGQNTDDTFSTATGYSETTISQMMPRRNVIFDKTLHHKYYNPKQSNTECSTYY